MPFCLDRKRGAAPVARRSGLAGRSRLVVQRGGEMGEEEFLSVMSNMDIMLSMRLHGLIFATVCNAWPIGISYDPKIQSLLEEMGRESAMEVESIDSAELVRQIDFAMENMDQLKEQTADTAHLMREKALLNHKMVKELLTGENIRR